MQTLDNAIRLAPKRRLLGRGVRLQTEQDPEQPNPTFIPAAEAVARWFAERTGGIAQGGLTESLLNIPTTAHILGGAVIGTDPESGVIDAANRVFGYENLLVCDGAAMPANPGVNPSLTITAMAERAMSQVPPKNGAEIGATCRSTARPCPAQAPVAVRRSVLRALRRLRRSRCRRRPEAQLPSAAVRSRASPASPSACRRRPRLRGRAIDLEHGQLVRPLVP